ncbi:MULTISPECIES: ATP-binding cassette domain-containing protein [Catenuloplanes]|uniref:ABC-2 type transport system ATP-binding protein n=1 Tax=Catenuloplanes niger TaxID=587534 RepID=A0AAE4CXL3_9ACTN|nr:ATP-binding cassette domain-containing protein [Catenuloplanes niger]MDR7324944.1 ABC-2 type transport system ATP-binding protein [Catenuloplanes niger]
MPVVEARGLGVRHRREWIFRDVDVDVDEHELCALTGPPGSGRTSLLLALAGRLRVDAGTLCRSGPAALALVPGVHEPEPALTVAEQLRERALLLGRRDRPETPFGLDPAARVARLTPYRRQLLGLALARLGEPRLIVADDVDLGLDAVERAALRDVLASVAAAGPAVIVTCREALDQDIRTFSTGVAA